MVTEADLQQYIATALWSSNDESDESGGEPMDANYGAEDLAPETLARMRTDLEQFEAVAGELITEHPDPTMWAHDFWLTRNGHGAGFWDGDWPENGDRLTALCGWRTEFGEINLTIGDDGKIYQE